MAAVVAFAAMGRSAAAQFNVDELELHVTPNGPSAIVQAFSVRSTADTVQQLQFVLSDWERDSAGVNRFVPLGEQAGTCGDRVDVFPQTLQLRPGAVEFVRVTYRPRTEAPETGCWAVVQARSVSPPSDGGGRMGVNISMVIGVKLYVHAPDAVIAAEVVSADVEDVWRVTETGDSVQSAQAAVRLANTGTAHLRVVTKVEVRNERTELLKAFDGPLAYITPMAFRDILVPLPRDLAPGRYVVVILLDYGGDEITAAQLDFEVP
ncbi:hypothetical protein Strain138_001229 [Pseudogemmatithrix spongiicola]|uniref:Pili assembly chaperone N-terminal domain-containing protein n=1 Tax=Pseudogemmatithrix spongiicola TaxID=3062599 RepID=A0AA49K0A5_9BACT|nr:hypothetical protein Strain138_001229 [Gemmatimonadaceae bacterium 'strain 138']WKW14868.1 hypothetical protein Strain318_001229 [Gemmatimonadaceae bacterium 'strain 318']